MQELMLEGNVAVALDIGTTRVCIVVAETDASGKFKVLGKGSSHSDGLRRAAVVNINKTVDAIRAAVADVERDSSLIIHGVNVVLSGAHVHCMQSNAEISINQSGVVNESDVKRFLEKARDNIQNLDVNHEIIHVLPQEFFVDGQDRLLDPIGMAGTTMRGSAYIVVGLRTKIRNIRQSLDKAGLKIGTLTFKPLAFGVAVIKEREKKGGVVVIDIGGGTTEVAIYIGGAIHYSEVINVAANDITLDIAHGLQIDEKAAEEIKIKYGSAVRMTSDDEDMVIEGSDGEAPKSCPKSSLTVIIEARMMEILELVRDSLLQSGYEADINDGAIITGGGSLLPGVVELARHILGLEVRIGSPEMLSAGNKGSLNTPQDSTVMGLVAHILDNNGCSASSPFTSSTEPPRRPSSPESPQILKVQEPNLAWKKVVDGFQDWWAKL